MKVTRSKWLVAGVVLCGTTAASWASEPAGSEMAAMKAEMAQLRAELADVRRANGEDWMSERRSAEVRAVVEDVLADAQARASFAEDAPSAGIDKKGKIFLTSPKKDFLLNIGGQFQFRWIGYSQDSNSDETDAGFQIRRAKLAFSGHVTAADQKILYKFTLASERDGDVSRTTVVTGVTGTDTNTDGNIDSVTSTTTSLGASSGGYGDADTILEDYVVTFPTPVENLTVVIGKDKLPFLRQELMSSARQLAVERAAATEYFTLNRAELIMANYKHEMMRFNLAFSDGANSEATDSYADLVEIALTGRVEIDIMGDSKAAADNASWDGEDQYLGLGAAVHWELGDGINGGAADYTGWTVDALYEALGFSVMAAVMGGHIAPDAAATANKDTIGFLVEGGYFIIPDKFQPFVRWEYVDMDPGEFSGITVGANYYLNKHNAKFTVDVLWLYDNEDAISQNRISSTGQQFGANPASSGLGLSSGFFGATADDLFLLRAQFQLLF